MKAVLSPFRKNDKGHKKQSSAPADDELDFKPTETAWEAAGTKFRTRGKFGTRARGNLAHLLKKKPTREPLRSPSDNAAVDLSSLEFSRLGSNKALNNGGPSEMSQDHENLINPPTRRRLSHLGSSFPSLLSPKPMMSSFSLRQTSIATSSTTDDSSDRLLETGMLLRGSSEGSDPDAERESKKYRIRRMSMEGAIQPLSTSLHSSFSHLAASAQDWKQIEGTTPPKTTKSHEAAGSPSRSVASCRKRAVGGSPIFSDNDDMSSHGCLSGSRSCGSTSMRPIRSRTRIFSPDGPGAPLLPFSLPSMDAIAAPVHETSPNERGVMDIDSDRDSDDDASEPDSPNSSFEVEYTNNMQHHEYETSQHAETEHDVLESMSSFPHLKFLVKALRLEAKRAPTTFGEKTSWTVAPSQSWHPTRRAEFYQWATMKLGFTVRAVGNSNSYLQISKAKGTNVLEKLSKAIKVYKEAERGKKRASLVRGKSVSETFNLMDRFNAKQPPSTLRRRSSMSMLPYPPGMSRPSFENVDMTALDLASQLQNLSVYDKSPKTSDISSQSQPLVRLVTLESPVDGEPLPRTSLEHSIMDSQDIMFHMQGRVSDDGMIRRRPPRNSGASMHSTTSLNSHRSSAPIPTIGAALSFDLLETPCMNDHKDWGSCPFQGRDWGESERCENSTLDVLLVRFEQSAQQGGMGDLTSPDMSSALNFEYDMECETERSDDMKISPENKAVVRFDARSAAPVVMDERERQKRQKAFAKLRRISLCYQLAVGNDNALSQPQPSSLFSESCPMKIDAIRERITSEGSIEFFEVDDCSSTTFDWESKELPLDTIFAFLTEAELKMKASLVSRAWADGAAKAHATLMTACVGYLLKSSGDDDEGSLGEDLDDDVDIDDDLDGVTVPVMDSVARSMERPWSYLVQTFPWGRYLAEGGMKKVYKTFNSRVGAEEAVAVMDVEHIREKSVVAAELAVSSLLSDLVRRGVCPNFVLIRGVFNCPYAPPKSHWGSEDNKAPKGPRYDQKKCVRLPREPAGGSPGRYHYIRMELCDFGDAEQYIKAQPEAIIPRRLAQSILFQTAFALHAAADRCSMKHYDIKLLNCFLQGIPTNRGAGSGDIVLRYGLGSHVFSLRMPSNEALFAKLADYGTANVKPESNGQPVTIGQFTTIENTPPDFMILGDRAAQGHGHDNWGLGLVMLHLFTGEAPYEELLEDVVCPPALKKRLRNVWEDETVEGYEVIRSVILSDVELDEAGHIIDGEPDETAYNTLYRILVLFGIPEDMFRRKECPKVWDAIVDTLVGSSKAAKGRGAAGRRVKGPDASQYSCDCRKFSIRTGSNKCIARARASLECMEGGLDLLLGLCSLDPVKRWSAMDVMNSTFMAPLREVPGTAYDANATVHSFTAFSTHR